MHDGFHGRRAGRQGWRWVARSGVAHGERVVDQTQDAALLSRLAWVLQREKETVAAGKLLDRAVALKPGNVSDAQAAAVAIAGITALQALRDRGHIRAGQNVLVNGASGGVGTFAVQIAKSYGATVTGVCSTKNVELVRSLGADRVIDYTQEDFTKGSRRYDLILDNVSTRSLSDYRRVLNPNGAYVMVGSTEPGYWFGWLAKPLEAWLMAPFTSQKFGMILAELNKDDLATLAGLMESGKVTPVIDKTYRLSEAAEALRYLEKGHARGKVVITVAEAQ